MTARSIAPAPVLDMPDTLFLDGEAIVIDKPSGLPVSRPRHGGHSIDDLVDAWRFGFARAPVPVHRLDQDTSGCLLLARNPKAQKRFHWAFEQQLIRKTYVAIVDGVPDCDDGIIDMALGKQSTAANGWRMVADPTGKPARTRWSLLASQNKRALIALFPETGRTHQLRVHMAQALDCPILHDPVYGRGAPHPPPGSMMLHALRLVVPRDGKSTIDVTSPWPNRFVAMGFLEMTVVDKAHG